jgi:hypothetical protein
MTEYLRVTPQCCSQSKENKVPYLDFNRENDRAERKYELLSNMKPVWCIKGVYRYGVGEWEVSTEVKFCPFCGVDLPEIELNPLTEDKSIYDTDSGDYCETCSERSMCCECLPAPFRWKPVGVELILPIIDSND